MPKLFDIRTAEADDAQQLSEFAERTFRDTFGAMNTEDDMNLHARESYSAAIQSAELSNPDMLTLLCEANSQLIGFAQLRWNLSPDCIIAKNPGEIQRLYVDREWHGRGVARELMNACIERLQRHHSDVAWLGVWEKNPRAIAFYRKLGFVEVGAQSFRLGTDIQRDLVMCRPVKLQDAR
jgi:ribosomal protein S18 acetylase RimI-like enzyme